MAARVLVVDDDEDMLATIAAVLELHGYQVSVASNGQRALDEVTRAMPDLVLLDLKMPILNGWQFAAEYRLRWPDAHAPIVVLSAVDDPAQRALEVGAASFVAKPFELKELLRVVSMHVSAAHAPPRA